MTLKDQLKEDVLSVFLNTDDHAELVTYTPFGGAPKSIKAVVSRGERDAPADLGGIRLLNATLLIANDATAGVSQPTNRDKVSVPLIAGAAAQAARVVGSRPKGDELWEVDVRA